MFLERPFLFEEYLQAFFAMGPKKSPWLDGIIVEFFKKLQQELSEPIIFITNKAFQEGKMEQNILREIIKPIPKKVSYHMLKNWLPISMMMVVYKIIAKLSPILDKVLSPHKHGLIKGTSIYNNILIAMMGIDYAKLSHQIFLLLQQGGS